MDGVWLAALSGLIGGGTLLVGAGVAWFVDIPQRVVAGIMALGAGVLISTLAFELVEEAADVGGLVPTTAGFLGGAVLYIVADQLISRPRKPSRLRRSRRTGRPRLIRMPVPPTRPRTSPPVAPSRGPRAVRAS